MATSRSTITLRELQDVQAAMEAHLDFAAEEVTDSVEDAQAAMEAHLDYAVEEVTDSIEDAQAAIEAHIDASNEELSEQLDDISNKISRVNGTPKSWLFWFLTIATTIGVPGLVWIYFFTHKVERTNDQGVIEMVMKIDPMILAILLFSLGVLIFSIWVTQIAKYFPDDTE